MIPWSKIFLALALITTMPIWFWFVVEMMAFMYMFLSATFVVFAFGSSLVLLFREK